MGNKVTVKSTLEKSVLDYLESKTESLIDEENEDATILKCQSPIEKMMYLALEDLLKHFEVIGPARLMHYIDTQVKIKFNSVTYKVDIHLHFTDLELEKYHDFVIECDGHEFREKTKEQVRNDRQRERNLMRLGHQVIRFSGSEIVENPDECAYQVWKIVETTLKSRGSYGG